MQKYSSPSFYLFITCIFLLLSAPQAFAMSDADVKHWIEAKAAGSPVLMIANRVRVDVDDGIVVLSGRVRLLAQRMEYDQIARQTNGVKEVDNEIHVVPDIAVSDAEIERQVRYIVFDTYRRYWHHQMDAHIGVDKGRVRIRASLRRPRDLIMLKHRLAKIEGITELEIESVRPLPR
jgi:hypothetical protein